MLDNLLYKTKKIIPSKLFGLFQPAYHFALAFLGAVVYRFPSKEIKIIAVTGTKGKSSTVEIISAIFEEAGLKTALTNTIRFKIGERSEENLFKMSMPGRLFMQRFLRKAVNAKCDVAILEITSQGSLLKRHSFMDLDALVVTNITPEHIEAHGSYEAYVEAKVDIARALSNSKKKDRTIIVNADDKEKERFLAIKADRYVTYSMDNVAPFEIRPEGLKFTFGGKSVHSPLSGAFNLSNIVAAIITAKYQGIEDSKITSAIEKFSSIPGRVQKIEAGQPFAVIVDYAHTPDSLNKLYSHYAGRRKICVLGGTGGGRDSWKRKEMGKIADSNCAEIILTDEDPYDEDPNQIVKDVAEGIVNKQPKIIMDRREAIREAISSAGADDVILITGKGTDPYVMGPNGTKIPWSDAKVAKEELDVYLNSIR